MRNPRYEILIFFTYALMIAVAVFLNFFTAGQAGGTANLIVNAVMFILVGIIFFVCVTGSLWPVAGITGDLRRVSLKIEEDAKHTHNYLWERYRDEKEELFKDRILTRQYQDYGYELERIVLTDKTYYKCNIEDYIGYDLIDAVIHRENLNQVAGVMTGLGILGTFIGLSLGLQSFNTGTTAEITNSIEPLMEGIKVAFHTSIFGMVFSLVFNYVYKRRLGDAESAVREFLGVYRKFVMPDTATDGVNRLMELQQQQAEAVLSLSDTVVRELPRGFKDVLRPEFDRFNETIENFANVATRNQTEQLKKIVDAFIGELNRSLDDSFVNLSKTIDKTLELQSENEKQMREIFERNLSTAENVNAISADTRTLSSSLREYASFASKLEESIYKEAEALAAQSAAQQKLLKAMPSEVDETFRIINENLKDVETHFRDTIQEINTTLNRVQNSVEELTYTVRELNGTDRHRR